MDELEALNGRIGTLEQRLRLATRVGLLFPLIAGCALILGQTLPSDQQSKRVIEADEFLVRDRHGNPCIRIGAENNTPSVKILDSQGDAIVVLQGFNDSTHEGLVLVRAKNGMTGSLSAGSAHVNLSLSTGMDKKALEKWMRDVAEGGKDAFIAGAKNPDPKQSWVKLSLDERTNEISIWKGGQPRGSWFAEDDYTQIYLSDKDGKARGVWDIAYGAAALTLLDSAMKSRLVLGREELKDVKSGTVQRRSESSILLFGEDGKVIFSAP